MSGTIVRLADHDVKPGAEADMGDGAAWPAIRRQILAADILVIATPVWMGQVSSVTKRAFERLDADVSVPAQGATYWVGRAMESVDYKDLDETPKAVASTNSTVAAGAAHLATLLKNSPY